MINSIHIPLTECINPILWPQDELAASIRYDIGFTHHHYDLITSYFHYKLGPKCISLKLIGCDIQERIYHEFSPGNNWIEQCMMAVM